MYTNGFIPTYFIDSSVNTELKNKNIDLLECKEYFCYDKLCYSEKKFSFYSRKI